MIMKRIIIIQIVAVVFLFCCLPFFTKAGHGKRICYHRDAQEFGVVVLADTIPAAARPTEAGKPAPAVAPIAGKPVAGVIKEVPKARKVTVPRQVTVKVQPVKVIKPKITRPVLKVL
jgi:hypothetical protein